MMPTTAATDHEAPVAAPWHDTDADRIDAELTCSAREVCTGYPSVLPAEAIGVLRRSVRPWADLSRCHS